MAEVDPDEADDRAGGVVLRRVAGDERLGTGQRVVARAAVDGVVAEAAEDDVVVAAVRSEERIDVERVDVERSQVD